MIKNKRILVTGGAGFIGSHLVDQLSRQNQVVVADDLSAGKRENLADAIRYRGVILKKADIRNLRLMRRLMKGIDIVFHAATQCLRLSFTKPHLVTDVNVVGTLSALTAARENKVHRFVYISSSEVYGTAIEAPMREDHPIRPTTVYGATKFAGELYTLSFFQRYGMPVNVIRPFNTYGPRSHFEGYSGEVIPKFLVRLMSGKPPVIFGDGKQTRDFTYVSDVVDGMIRAAASDKLIGKPVNIAYGREISINEIAREVISLFGEKLKPVYEAPRPSDVRRHFADVRLAGQKLSYTAKIPIRSGLKIFADWFQSTYRNRLSKAISSEVKRNW